MDISVIATVIILTVLFVILSSLAFGLFYLLHGSRGNKRTVMALSVRVALSLLLFAGLLLAVHLGWIVPNPRPLSNHDLQSPY